MSTGDQWCHGVPISDGHIPETGAQILRSPAPSERRRHSGRARGGGPRAGWRGSARLGARAAAGPCAPLPRVHGRPQLPSLVRRARRQTPPPLGYFYFNPRGFVPFLLTRAWTGFQLAQKGWLRERGDAGGRAQGPHPSPPRPGARAHRRRSLAARAPRAARPASARGPQARRAHGRRRRRGAPALGGGPAAPPRPHPHGGERHSAPRGFRALP